jgi:hypothetical protein
MNESVCPARAPGHGPCIITTPHRIHDDGSGDRWTEEMVAPPRPARAETPAPASGAYVTENTAFLVRPAWLPLETWLKFVQEANLLLAAPDLDTFDRRAIPPGAVVVTVADGVIRHGLVGQDSTAWEARTVLVSTNGHVAAPRSEPAVLYVDGTYTTLSKVLATLEHDRAAVADGEQPP